MTLYERIGGAETLDVLVDRFYRRVLTDPRVFHFFQGIDMAQQRVKQKAFLSMALGGPEHYAGRDLRAAHAHLVAQGLDDTHFNAFIEHLRTSLHEQGIAPELIGQAMALAGSMRDDVLGR
ncbi:MAG: group 1 truncated hemoglobin [Gammaproteobacteria bacterium]|nr:group 1 truncated hemoglobin [Gammaproteobacteria bacterium]